MSLIDSILQGILLGGYYAILAAGLSLMFGVVRFINLAHGDLAIVGAYLVLAIVGLFEISPFVALIIVLPIMAALGWVLQAALFARTLRGGFLLPLLTTFGLGAVLQNALHGVFGSDTRSLGNYIGAFSWESFDLPADLSVGRLPVMTFATSVLVLGALQMMLSHTKLGRAIRATSEDADTAGLIGIDAKNIYRCAAAIAVVLAGLAGVFLAMRASIAPYSGPPQLIFAFEAVVIGGMGSLWGTLIGGIALGVAQNIGAQLSSQWFQLAGHLLFLAVLGVRLLVAHAKNHGGWRSILGWQS
jgi:branched-chain amino acid transport system permease protein